MATIREIAKSAGVSTATVSRVMNENGYVSEASRDKVVRAMAAAGYNPADRFHRRGPSGSPWAFLKSRSFTLLCAVRGPFSETLTGMGLMQGISEGLRFMGANLVIEYVDPNSPVPRCLTGKGTDGVFLHGSPFSGCQHEVAKHHVPVVWLLQTGGDVYGDRVQPDHWSAGVSSYNELVGRGCASVCCIGSPCRSVHVEYWHSRAEGFRHAAACNGTVCHTISTENSGLGASEALVEVAAGVVDEFCKLSSRPEGIFVANGLGPYIHDALKQRGIIPMQDVCLVAGDCDSIGSHLSPAPISIDVRPTQLGALAVDAMMWRIKNPHADRVTHVLQPKLIVKP